MILPFNIAAKIECTNRAYIGSLTQFILLFVDYACKYDRDYTHEAYYRYCDSLVNHRGLECFQSNNGGDI